MALKHIAKHVEKHMDLKEALEAADVEMGEILEEWAKVREEKEKLAGEVAELRAEINELKLSAADVAKNEAALESFVRAHGVGNFFLDGSVRILAQLPDQGEARTLIKAVTAEADAIREEKGSAETRAEDAEASLKAAEAEFEDDPCRLCGGRLLAGQSFQDCLTCAARDKANEEFYRRNPSERRAPDPLASALSGLGVAAPVAVGLTASASPASPEKPKRARARRSA
jgi:hypothetical protein